MGSRHMGHRGGDLDMMLSAHDSQAHCMQKQTSAKSAVQHRICQPCTVTTICMKKEVRNGR